MNQPPWMVKTSWGGGAGVVPTHLGLGVSSPRKRMERMGWPRGAIGHPWLGTGVAGASTSA